MDLGLYARVLWRFKFIVGAGFVLAVALTVFSVAHVSLAGGKPKLAYRTPEIWRSQASLLLTQQGFPWGRSVFPSVPAAPATGRAAPAPATPSFADQTRFTSLVAIYAKLVNSDAVRRKLRLAPNEGVQAQVVADTSVWGANPALPILAIAGDAPSPTEARAVADQAAGVFRLYIDQQQKAASIPKGQRVILQMINSATPAVLFAPRKKTLPMLAFLTVMIATLGLVFILENVRPAPRRVLEDREQNDRETEFLRKSA